MSFSVAKINELLFFSNVIFNNNVIFANLYLIGI